jgi:hypothetical protein
MIEGVRMQFQDAAGRGGGGIIRTPRKRKRPIDHRSLSVQPKYPERERNEKHMDGGLRFRRPGIHKQRAFFFGKAPAEHQTEEFAAKSAADPNPPREFQTPGDRPYGGRPAASSDKFRIAHHPSIKARRIRRACKFY